MTKLNLTLNQAIASHFDIDGRTLPEFKSSKPVVEAREWLARNDHNVEYLKRSLPTDNKGVVVYSRGGIPMFGVIDGDVTELRGSTVLGSLVKVASKPAKTRKKREKVENNEKNDEIDTNVNDESDTGNE
jgi:hypothetical protein